MSNIFNNIETKNILKENLFVFKELSHFTLKLSASSARRNRNIVEKTGWNNSMIDH